MEDRKRNQILLVLFMGVLMGALDIAAVGPALPAIQKSFGVGERALIRLASQEMSNLSPQNRTHFGLIYYEKFVGQIEALLAKGVKTGELRPMDPKATTWILLGMMYPFFYPGHNREMGEPEEIIPFLLSVFFEGVSQK